MSYEQRDLFKVAAPIILESFIKFMKKRNLIFAEVQNVNNGGLAISQIVPISGADFKKWYIERYLEWAEK